MKIKEVFRNLKTTPGLFKSNNIKMERGEALTIEYLLLFGFDVEFICPSSTKRAKNPDILMLGSIWEIKTPTSSNQKTIKNRFKKASSQATKIIFDLRGIETNADRAQRQIIDLFSQEGTVRRIMIIDKDGRLLDIKK